MIQAQPKRLSLKSTNDTFTLLAISDVHHAQESSNESLLIDNLKESHPNRLIIGIGDELDCIARADLKRHRMEDLKDKFLTKKNYPRLIDAELDDYTEILRKYTTPGEWLGHLSGNHPLALTMNGVDPVQALCTRLGHTYLGYSAFVPIILECQGRRLSVMIMAHHGFGGTNSRKEGSGVNAYIDHALRYEGWDICLYGHRHDRWAKRVPRIKPQTMQKGKHFWVKSIDRLVCQCGTYQRTLACGEYPTYSERFGFIPRPLGALKITLGVKRERNNKDGNGFYLNIIGTNA